MRKNPSLSSNIWLKGTGSTYKQLTIETLNADFIDIHQTGKRDYKFLWKESSGWPEGICTPENKQNQQQYQINPLSWPPPQLTKLHDKLIPVGDQQNSNCSGGSGDQHEACQPLPPPPSWGMHRPLSHDDEILSGRNISAVGETRFLPNPLLPLKMSSSWDKITSTMGRDCPAIWWLNVGWA